MLNHLHATLLATTPVATPAAASASGLSVDGAAAAVTGQTSGRPRQLATITVTASLYVAGQLRIYIEHSEDDVNWVPATGGSAIIVGDGVTKLCVYGLSQWVRVSYDSTAGTDLSVGVEADLHQSYAEPSAMRKGSVIAQRGTFSDADLWGALASASEQCAGYMPASSVLPLVDWGSDLERVVIDVAQYDLQTSHGIDPDNDADQVILYRYEAATKRLAAASRGQYTFTNVVDQTPTIDEAECYFYVGTQRGW